MRGQGQWGWWLAERTRELALWPVNLVRDFPGRVRRLSQSAVVGPGGWPGRVHTLLCALFDLVGGPEIAQLVMHLGMHTTPLSRMEVAAAAAVLGPGAIRYGEVRVAEGGILRLVFHFNGNRAFATWHTVHLPRDGAHRRADLSLLVHELTHVFQYEQVGTRYLGEAVAAQLRQGPACYRYGGPAGLAEACIQGRRYADFNREAQAQIAQDYYRLRVAGEDGAAYAPFIAELRAGRF